MYLNRHVFVMAILQTSEKGSTLKRKYILPLGAKSFFFE